MKKISTNLLKVVANAAVLAITVAFSYSANAQSVQLPGENLSPNAPNSVSEFALLSESESNTKAMGTTQPARLDAATQASELLRAVDQAISLLSLEELALSETKASAVIGGSNSLIDENSVTVKVNYEEHPAGGILTVRASTAPTFRGVGVSIRPEITRSVAMAVDAFDAELVKELARDLTSEISANFAAN